MRAFAAALCLAVSLIAGSGGHADAQSFEERAAACLGCHGEKGTSDIAETPSLGGQPAPYSVIQLYMFRENLRTAPPMNDMAQGIPDAELQKFADLIAALPPPQPAGNGDPARMARGEALIGPHRCAFCHGADFAGGDSVPRIRAQREDYLLKSLNGYKTGERREYQPVMAEVIQPLSETDIADLAYYLAHYPKGGS